MTDRTPEQYAIEHGRYLADAARQFMKACGEYALAVETEADPNSDTLLDAYRALTGAIYDFEKRADRAYPKTKPTQPAN